MNTATFSDIRRWSNLADTPFPPDNASSPAARFLASIADDVAELVDRNPDEREDGWADDDAVHEIADQAVPVYNRELWDVFSELGAWAEDPVEIGASAEDMTQAGQACLYIIARRLTVALLDEWRRFAEDAAEDMREDAQT